MHQIKIPAKYFKCLNSSLAQLLHEFLVPVAYVQGSPMYAYAGGSDGLKLDVGL